jgi:hypothetical protein
MSLGAAAAGVVVGGIGVAHLVMQKVVQMTFSDTENRAESNGDFTHVDSELSNSR